MMWRTCNEMRFLDIIILNGFDGLGRTEEDLRQNDVNGKKRWPIVLDESKLLWQRHSRMNQFNIF